jgi:hypothetical protein
MTVVRRGLPLHHLSIPFVGCFDSGVLYRVVGCCLLSQRFSGGLRQMFWGLQIYVLGDWGVFATSCGAVVVLWGVCLVWVDGKGVCPSNHIEGKGKFGFLIHMEKPEQGDPIN